MKNRLLTPELLEALKPFPLYSQEETRIHEQKANAEKQGDKRPKS